MLFSVSWKPYLLLTIFVITTTFLITLLNRSWPQSIYFQHIRINTPNCRHVYFSLALDWNNKSDRFYVSHVPKKLIKVKSWKQTSKWKGCSLSIHKFGKFSSSSCNISILYVTAHCPSEKLNVEENWVPLRKFGQWIVVAVARDYGTVKIVRVSYSIYRDRATHGYVFNVPFSFFFAFEEFCSQILTLS